MTLTWSDLKVRVLLELKDDGQNRKWSDDLLYIWLKDALADYSLYAPLEQTSTLSNPSGASYALPSDCLRVDLVESPSGTFLKPGLYRPNVKLSSSTTVSRYHVTRTTLTLNAETSEDVVIHYKGTHPAPSSSDDDTFSLTFIDNDAELISLFIRAKAFEQNRSLQANLDRYKLGGGSRQDNPLEPEVNYLMMEYERKILRRYSGGTIQLYRR